MSPLLARVLPFGLYMAFIAVQEIGGHLPQNPEKPEIHGGFALSHWCGDRECEEKIKNDLSVTIRCIPLDSVKEAGRCVMCGKPSGHRVIFAKSY